MSEELVILGVGNQVAARLGLPAEWYATLVHPAASVSPYAQVGAGTVNPR
jgi:hypothetical protein